MTSAKLSFKNKKTRSARRLATLRKGLAALCLAAVIAAAGLAGAAHAQRFERIEDINTNVNSYYYFVRPGEATMEISVWGTVESPGAYQIGTEYDLGMVLSLAGGPEFGVRQERSERRVTLELYRGQAGTRSLVYEASLNQAVSAPERYPSLQDGDVLIVETLERDRFSWRDALTIVAGVATLTLAVERIVAVAN